MMSLAGPERRSTRCGSGSSVDAVSSTLKDRIDVHIDVHQGRLVAEDADKFRAPHRQTKVR